ncbi:MAG TPA: ATP-grasp domain-containing protein [Bryobacteraceae bacterium]|nr:ATP-grasp domain-containing protein [Bryobacteraceae bacterium]
MKGTLLIGNLPRIVIPVARRLAARGIPVHAALIGRGRHLTSRALRSFTWLPDNEREPERFLEELRALIQERDIDTIMPCGDECLKALMACDEQVRELAYYCAPKPESVEKILHKPDTLAVAEAAGISVPRDYHIPDVVMLTAMRHEIRFPVIVKPRSREGEIATGIKSEAVHNFERLREHFDRFPDFGKWFLIQDYIPGHGVAVDMLMHEGHPVAATQHRRIREYPVRGGVSISAETEPIDPELLRESIALLRALEWEGVAMVEFRKDPVSGRIGLMEVNGRFWGSISLALHSGVDFPWYLWQIAHGERPAPAIPRAGTRFRWLAGDLKRMWEAITSPERYGWRVAAQAFTDFASTKDSIWSWSDPWPAVQEFLFAVGAVGFMAAGTAARAALSPAAYHRLRTMRQAGITVPLKYVRKALMRPGRFRPFQKPVRSVVFICHGNIMRSPMAEVMFRAAAPHIRTESAGTFAIPGRNADARAARVATEFGFSLEGHHAQPLSQEMIDAADLLVVMDYVNYIVLTDRFPEAARKTILLGSLEPGAALEIDDPYEGTLDDVRKAYKRVQTCSRLLVEAIHSTPMNRTAPTMGTRTTVA